MPKPHLACAYILHDDYWYLAESITSVRRAGPVFCFVSRVPWADEPGDWEQTARIATEAGAEVVLGEWRCELDHRLGAFDALKERGFTHALIPDGDEIVEPALLRALCKAARADQTDRLHCHMDTYWKSPEYVVRPRESLTPAMMVRLDRARPVGLSRFEGGRSLALAPVAGNLANKAIGPHILDLGAGPRPVALDVTGRVTRVDRVMHGRHTVYAFDARKVHAYPQGLHEGSFDIIFLNNPYGMRTGEAVYRKWCRLLGPRGMVVIQGHISNREFAAMWTRDDEWIRKLGFRQVLRRVGGKPIGGSFSSTDPAGTPPRPDKIMVWAK